MARTGQGRRLLATLAVLAVPALASAQPSLTAASINGANAAGGYASNWWSTVPSAHGNWEMFLSTNAFASFQANPLGGIPLVVGLNTFQFAASSAGANPMALNLFLDGATSPSISGFVEQGAGGTLDANTGQPTYNPFAAGFPGGTAAPLSVTTGGYTVTLTRFIYDLRVDRVGAHGALPDGSRDWNGAFDLTVERVTTTTPEPATVALLGGGLLAFAGVARARRRG